MSYVNFGRKSTREQALASRNRDKIFFPTDADSIILGGKEYGRQPKDIVFTKQIVGVAFDGNVDTQRLSRLEALAVLKDNVVGIEFDGNVDTQRLSKIEAENEYLKERLDMLESLQRYEIESTIQYPNCSEYGGDIYPQGDIYFAINTNRIDNVPITFSSDASASICRVFPDGTLQWRENFLPESRICTIFAECNYSGKTYRKTLYATQNPSLPDEGEQRYLYNGEVRDDDRVAADHGLIITFRYTQTKTHESESSLLFDSYSTFLTGIQSISYRLNASSSSSEYINQNGTEVQCAKISGWPGVFEVWKKEW